MITGITFRILRSIVHGILFCYHPILRVKGRENIPAEGSYLICPNHSGMADPIWVIIAMNQNFLPRIMAKKELMLVPVLGAVLRKLGVFGVDRSRADVNAIKTGLRCLQEGEPLMLFPEGTRVRNGVRPEPKAGAIMLANRTDRPIVPVYLTAKRRPFSTLHCVFGEPYKPDFDGKRPTEEQLQAESRTLMKKIYEMGEAL